MHSLGHRALNPRWLLYILPLAFVAVFFFYPLLSIFALSFAPQGTLDFGTLRKLVSTSYYVRTLWFTVWQAAVSTALTVILALPGAYTFAHYKFRGKGLLKGSPGFSGVLSSPAKAKPPNSAKGGFFADWLNNCRTPALKDEASH